MLIEIVNVGPREAKDNYSQVNVAYKDENGKLQSKNVVSFGAPEVFETVSRSNKGDTFEIKVEKAGKYWNWVGISKSTATPTAAPTRSADAPAKGNWETAEERAQRQTYIIRQSCLSTAVAFGAYSNYSSDDVLTLAADFEQWVLRKEPMKEIIKMPNDIPQ